MIWLYTGTPGSGKTLHATDILLDALADKKTVVCNYPLDFSQYPKLRTNRFFYVKDADLSPQYLVDVAKAGFKQGKEGQGLLVVDEASILFNCREFNKKGRSQWVQFLQQHRHWGWEIILITQYDRMIDRQIRALVEYIVVHRRFDRMGLYGALFRMLRIPVFVAITYWYQMHMKTNTKFFLMKRKVSKSYNSWNTDVVFT